MVGRSLAHYQITGALGAGGMGEVFRATDTKLGRDVALKVLPSEMARDPERLARFQREARAVAALNHPHIVTIHSVEESEGIHFLTMELIEGESLAAVIPDGGLAVDRLVAIGTALADALAAAHDKGIVHRDLKPANVMLTRDGRVKVLDFGLAKELRPIDPAGATLTSAGHTQVGVIMGTPAYMSPEQVAGRPMDHRTDIFSLGILLYQIASGQRPFEGATSIELASAILRDTPRPVGELRSDVPSELARLIRRCLEKDPSRRVQTARDVGNELREIARAAPAATAEAASDASPARGGATHDVSRRSATAADAESFRVAVLPFKSVSSHPDVAALADGLSEEIVTGFSRFSYMRVIARGATARYAGSATDVRAIGREIGARYVMEGSVRQAGAQLRVTVQLVDTTTGAHLWAETYNRAFQPEAIFDLQDDVVPRIVSTVADWYGVLPRSMSDALRGRRAEELSSHEAVLRTCGYYERVGPVEHAEVREILEHAVKASPTASDCWAMLSFVYVDEYRHAFNPRPDPLERALNAALRAVETGPTSQMAYYALAGVRFFRKEMPAFQNAANRALAMNPMACSIVAFLGVLTAYAGDWDNGCAIIERAAQLNPNPPGWYWFAPVLRLYRQAQYEAAFQIAVKINLPEYFYTHVVCAAVHGQLGQQEPARDSLGRLLALRPNIAAIARAEFGKWYEPALVEHLIDGLRKAGLDIPDAPTPDAPAASSESPRRADSDLSRRSDAAAKADEGFWVAVLPFKCASPNADVAALAEGLSEEIITGFSRFTYLRVIARGSTLQYTSAADVRTFGRTLGARYVLDGSVRQAGSQIRVAVQLVDTETGAHLWAETYNRPFQPDAIFDLQDALVPVIVSTIADVNGVLTRSMGEALRGRTNLTPYEAVLRASGFWQRATPAEHAEMRLLLERVVEEAPDYADALALLSMLYQDEYRLGFNPLPDPLDRALTLARRAVDLAPTSFFGHHALASVLFFRRDLHAFRQSADRAVALNPMDASNLAYMGGLMCYAGDWPSGRALANRALSLNPNHPGWFWFVPFLDAYRQREYAAALDAIVKVHMPGYFMAQAHLLAAHGQVYGREGAHEALDRLLQLKAGIADTVRSEFGKWLEPALVEHLIEGLRKAGLDVPDASA